MKEFLDIIDENGQPTGEIVDRETARAKGILHRTSHVWLARRKNGKVQILLQKRAKHIRLKKKTHWMIQCVLFR